MKKFLIFPVLAVFVCGTIAAADFSLSAGAGGLLGGFFTRYHASASSGSAEMTQKLNQFNYGAFAFFDATYAELSVSLQKGVNSYDEIMTVEGTPAPREGDGWETMIGFSLLGKYPFTLSERVSLFPLLGVEYQVAVSEWRRQDEGSIYDRTSGTWGEKDQNNNALELPMWNSFWVNLGIGTDVFIINNFFVRGELLYGFRLMTPYEKDAMEGAKQWLGDDPEKGGLTSGPSLRISGGFRFWNL